MERDSGKEARFEGMYRSTYRSLLAFALRRVGDPEDARDVVAETFAITWRRLDDVPDGVSEKAWLFGVARRVLANHRRSRWRSSLLQDKLTAQRQMQAVEPGPPDSSLCVEALAALSRLPLKQQEVLRLAAWEGLSHGDVAVVLGCSANAVDVRLHRARKALQQAFEHELSRNKVDRCSRYSASARPPGDQTERGTYESGG